MKVMVQLVFFAIFLMMGCSLRVSYYGEKVINEVEYKAKVWVYPEKEEAMATITLRNRGEKEIFFVPEMIDFIAPSGAQSIPLEKPASTRFLLGKNQSTIVKARWRLINDPAFYQLYGMSGENLPQEYTLNLGRVTNQETVFLVVKASENEWKRYHKVLNPVLVHYKISLPNNFVKIQKEHLKSHGWIVSDEHDEHDEHDGHDSHEKAMITSSFFVVGDYTVLMDGRYYVGFYGFTRAKTFTMRVIFLNREAELLYFVPEKLVLRFGEKEIRPHVKKTLFQKKDKKGFALYRNQRGEWLLEYAIPQVSEELFLVVDEAFVSPSGISLFGVEGITLQAIR